MVRRLDTAGWRTAGWAVFLLVSGISWVAAGTDVVPGWERSVTRWAVDLPGWTTPMLWTVMQSGARLAPFVVALALALALRWRWQAVAVGAAGIAAWVTAEATKGTLDRARPTAATLGRPIRDAVHGHGYPSSHVAVAAAVCVAIGYLLPHRPPAVLAVLVTVPTLTALGRMHVGAHWFLDVVGGACCGAAVGRVVVLAARDAP